MAGIDSTRFKTQSSNAISYSDARYWNARYTEKSSDPKAADTSFAPFEWYVRYEQLKEALQPFLTEATAVASRPPSRVAVEGEEAEAEPEVPKPRILVLGCGTSAMSEDLYNEGFTNITNVDRCEPLIEHLAAKHDAKQTLLYEAHDVQNLP